MSVEQNGGTTSGNHSAVSNGEEKKPAVEGEVLPPEADINEALGAIWGTLRELSLSGGGQAVLTAVATRMSAQTELERQRLVHDHEYRMAVQKQVHEQRVQADRLFYEQQQRREHLGVRLVIAGSVLIIILAIGLLVLMQNGLLSDSVVAQIGVLVGAVLAILKLKNQNKDSPPPPAQPPAGTNPP
jgi:hypothetical protein